MAAEGEHERRFQLRFGWPDPPLEIGLVEPQIPPNTGTIARLAAATGSRLHLVEPLGFEITDARLRRAGLDYWDAVDITRHADREGFAEACLGEERRVVLFSTAGERSVYDAEFRAGDVLVFGNEGRGLPDAWLERWPERVVQIPILTDHVRSLNLACSVSIAVYEALRQIDQV